MNELGIYGLPEGIFGKGNNGRTAFQSNDHKETLGILNRAKDEGGLVVITAAPGMGKSYALKCFSKSLDSQKYCVFYISLSTVSVTEFYRQLSDALNLDIKYGKAAMFMAIKTRIRELYRNHYHPIIIVDEAQDLNASVFREIKSLLSFEMDTLNCFLLVLSGESDLNTTLQKGSYESLNQRIQYHYHFRGLSAKENEEYVKHKIIQGGGDPSILDESAYTSLVGLSKGNARITDRIMTKALMIGAQNKRLTIDQEVIQAAFDSLKLG